MNLKNVTKGSSILNGTCYVESDAIVGGMAKIWKVRHPEWEISLAMKIPDSSGDIDRLREDFLRECSLWIDLGMNPYIVPCYFVVKEEGETAAFSEWMECGSLADKIRDGSLYEGTEAECSARILRVAAEVLLGLRYAHSNGVVHKDIKPGNILFSADGTARITDFGMSDSSSAGFSRPYCSPEQAKGKPLSKSTDIYSWAVMVMEMLTGDHSWGDGSRLSYSGFDKYLTQARVSVPLYFKVLLEKCFKSDPENRIDVDTAADIACGIYARIMMETEPENIADRRCFESCCAALNDRHTVSDMPFMLQLFREMLKFSKKSFFYNGSAAPNNGGICNNKALSCLMMGKEEEAERLWKEATRRYPNHRDCIYNYYTYLWERCRITNIELENYLAPIRNYNAFYRDEYKRIFGEPVFVMHTETPKVTENICLSGNMKMGFSGDRKKFYLVYRYEYEIVAEAFLTETGELLERYNDNVTVRNILEEIKAGNKLISDRFEFDTNVIDKKTGRIMNSVSGMQYIISADDSLYAICRSSADYNSSGKRSSAKYVNNIFIYSTEGADLHFRPRLSRSMLMNELLEREERYRVLMSEYETALEQDDPERQAECLNGMTDCTSYGRPQELLRLKRDFIAENSHILLLREPYVAEVRMLPEVITVSGNNDLTGAAFSPDGKYLVLAFNRKICFFDTEGPKLAAEMKLLDAEIKDCIDAVQISSAVTFDDSGDLLFINQVFNVRRSKDIYEKVERVTSFNIREQKLVSACADPDEYKDVHFKTKETDEELVKVCPYDNIIAVNPTKTMIAAVEKTDPVDYELLICFIDYAIDVDYDEMLDLSDWELGPFDPNYFGDEDDDLEEDTEEEELSEDDNENGCDKSEDTAEEEKSRLDEYSCFSGITKENEFLVDSLSSTLQGFLKRLSGVKLENPSIKFAANAKEAKRILDAGITDLSRVDPVIRQMIECTDEEYEDMMNVVKKQSELWMGRGECDFLSLYIRSNMPAKENAASIDAEEVTFFHKSAAEQRKVELPKLVKRIGYMRQQLLGCVKGQDHAVHAFADGLFNAEVLAAADSKRTRPKAIFTFAGPPGVGKTFLAEKAAEFLGMDYVDGVKRFDMSEFSGPQSHEQLIGFAFTYKASTEGTLTSYVRNHPKSILIFDELEKAHPMTIQLFYQILDAGILTDAYISTGKAAVENGSNNDMDSAQRKKFTETDPTVSFKDTIIIFTTNAGHSLYEGDKPASGSDISMQTITNALKADIDPITKQPYFPEAIISRIASGYPILFNKLTPHDLEQISHAEFERCGKLIKKQYNMNIGIEDNKVLLSILYANGGIVDARTLRAQTELFFKNELHKLFTLMTDDIPTMDKVLFRVETESMDSKMKELFTSGSKPKILLYTDERSAELLKTAVGDSAVLYNAADVHDALKLAEDKYPDFALISLKGSEHISDTDDTKTVYASISAHRWNEGRNLFKSLREKFPEMPVYLLEAFGDKIDGRLFTSFVRAGAEGKISIASGDDGGEFVSAITEVGRSLYMRSMAAKMAAQHKVLSFETAPRNNDGEITIALRNFKLIRAIDAEDANDILDSDEIPNLSFDDVIGAREAKESLKYFVKYFKDPREFIAKGLSLPKGILLYGKPGTGKTMIAKAMAAESGCAFFPAVGSMFIDGANKGPEGVRRLFRKARRYAPSIIFIDEVDTIAAQRTGNVYAKYEESILNTLLAEMDGFASDPQKPVFVMAATNYNVEPGSGIGVLDEAFMRRFDRQILVTLPDLEDRIKFLKLRLAKTAVHNVTEEGIKSVASRAMGISPAILDNVINAAKQLAFDANAPLSDEHMLEALEKVRFGEKREFSREYLERTAYHEAGHAVMYYLSGNIPGYITIEGRSNFGGYMEHSEEEVKRPYRSRKELLETIRTSLGGRAAEIVKYGEDDGLTTGISSDLRTATNNAVYMLTAYAMDSDFGLMSIEWEKAVEMDSVRSRVNEILAEEMSNTVNTLRANISLLETVTAALLERNRITGEEFKKLVENAAVTE
ncbi:MAG: AAA family ATPase [Oscillospiraceae bacterium]|nr:AAA family ATPase [Oscillospiraceae bacterium]